MKIPLIDLNVIHQKIKNELRTAFERVFTSSEFIFSEEVNRFEKEFASYCDVKHCIAVSSGTTSLQLAIIACGIKGGDKVVVPTFTFIATAESVINAGAEVVFADIDDKTYNIDPQSLEISIKKNKNIRAVIPVHLFGQPADIKEIQKICEKYEIKMIEDAAQAHGAQYKGKKVGSFGIAGCFSFYPAKNLGALGDAGCVVTNDDSIKNMVALLRDHGREEKYVHKIIGYNYRISALQASFLSVKLKYLDSWNEERRKIAQFYNTSLKKLPLILPTEKNDRKHVYHLYVIRTDKRNELKKHLQERGIATGIHYPIPLHLQPSFKFLGHRVGDFPVSEKVANEVLSLPIFPGLGEEKLQYIVDSIIDFFKKG